MPTILGDRYELSKKIESDPISESWLAVDSDLSPYLVKMWPYQTELPDDSLRALWNGELRILYRLCSSPGASESILTLHDAGLDRANKAFVMVLKSDTFSYDTLQVALTQRTNYPWLSLKSLKDPGNRARLWLGFLNIARGIDLLHTQHVLHRNVAAENIYFHSSAGPDSMRLGGFAWSVRLSDIRPLTEVNPWTNPPEATDSSAMSHTFNTDWYSFGMLLARSFYAVEAWKSQPPDELHRLVYQEVEQNKNATLFDIERNLILRLIAGRAQDRLIFGEDVIRHLDEIVTALSSGRAQTTSKSPLVLAIQRDNQLLLDAAHKAGFSVGPNASYSPHDEQHVVLLKRFLREDFANSLLYPGPGQRAILVGRRLSFQICQFRDHRTDEETWDVAYFVKPFDLKGSEGKSYTDLSGIAIHIAVRGEVPKLTDKQSWAPFLPVQATEPIWSEELNHFHEFLRCTNQLELLMRYAEIFAYETVDSETKDGFEFISIKEREGVRDIPDFCKIDGGLVEFLQREMGTSKPDCDKVLLTQTDSLMVGNVAVDDWWRVLDIESRVIKLIRKIPTQTKQNAAPTVGFLRTYGLYGQTTLIDRRKIAIDRLKNHSYLLRSIVQPGLLSIDTGAASLPFELPADKVDESKRAVIEDILRARPIYSLQGPPGTGKTTLVAYLLREIFEDDPVAQVLVTAQAHVAVDVLRKKVRQGSFADKPINQQPLAIRIGVKEQNESGEAHEDTVEQASKRVLEESYRQLKDSQERSSVQDEWFHFLDTQLQSSILNDAPFFADFQRLVKQGASITYCTTSAGDLADLVKGSQSFDWSFDWSIIEEAGRVHGFDLALPLQAGHRWMLLGDHRQLPPYRIDYYSKAIEKLDVVVEFLNKFELRDRRLVDHVWVNDWKDKKDDEARQRTIKYFKNWLKTFATLFDTLSNIYGQPRITNTESIGAKAGSLSIQYRMHPTIGNLISEAFYDGTIENGTQLPSGVIIPEVCHPLSSPLLSAGLDIRDKAIVWLDLPWCQHEPDCEELGPDQKEPKYTNPVEIEATKAFLSNLEVTDKLSEQLKLAILSPYSRQVWGFYKAFQNFDLPEHFVPVESLTATRRVGQQNRWAHTVDSFQGNQAHIIVVSLVRNNRKLPPTGLGFLQETSRLNVLLSRAEKLLVLVGSWDFFQKQLESVSLDDTAHPLLSFKKAMDYMSSSVAAGTAVKIPALTTYQIRRHSLK